MDEVGPLVGLADIVVFPYKTATASGALALAQSQGRATIATEVGGLAEVIHHGRDGWLVPPNDVEALGAAMAYLLENPGVRKALGEAAEARIQSERSWDVVADRVVKILESDADVTAEDYSCATTGTSA
jgi:glycosyltransferase involved in cell wall biosynthesis